ncbi:FecR domain-containing protein [Novosphingobium sp. RL4]|uniref:FecR domain-containing protein n=1 Tax=Novosphingobium sp. RL4 TaxID=3109595 RepID=UPI002D7A3EAF|nr:FecR domain-containing protein [Novosphingobium sp. RL4]WRT95288.1 FecR domain-containing protein [Novosphingobium sp. RL4]
MNSRFLCRASLAAALLATSAGVRAETPAHVAYSVNRNDTLYDLARRYFADPASYPVVQKLNRIGNPRRIPVGRILKIPRSMLRREPIEAVVQSYRGAVLVGARSAAVGLRVREGDLIETGERSFVSLRLPDSTTVSLPPGSRVRVERLRRTLLAESVERRFVVQRGQASGIVTPMTDPHSTFEFLTPRAMTSVRGTRFRTSYDPASGASKVEVSEGKVAFRETREKEQFVVAGFGTNDGLAAPVPLLAPPELMSPDRVQAEEQLVFAARPVVGAARYRFQIARDAGFMDVLDEAYAQVPRAEFAGLPRGTYFVRMAGMDGNDLEGLASTYSFERRLNRLRTSFEESRAGRYRQFLFRWQAPDAPEASFRFQLSRSPDGSAPLVDQTGLTGDAFVITDLAAGTYYWRVMSIEAAEGQVYTKWSSANELRVGAAK